MTPMTARLWLAVVAMGGSLACERPRSSPLVEAARACHDSEISCPRPILAVRDLKASGRYYRDALGFKIDWEYGDPPDFGSVSRADGVLFLSQGHQSTRGGWTMMFVRDVDRLHEEFRKNRAIVQMPPTDMPWGLREMQVADLDGNVLRFGSAIERN
jgi:catechol 2,3-dioxygenase-like lactoylglutathione lyase family enzyme